MFTPGGIPIVRRRGKWIDVLTVKRGAPIKCMIIGVEPVVVQIHYHKRSYLCGGRDDCALCEAGVGSQSMMFIAVAVGKRIAMVRAAYSQYLVDRLTLGVVCELSLPKVGASYDLRTWDVREIGGNAITAGAILQRIIVLHGLDPKGDQLVSAAAAWEANLPQIKMRAVMGARAFVGAKEQPVG